MSTIDARLQTIRRAILAFRDTPGRVGRFIQLTDADSVLVGGDMHGHVDNFRRLMQLADLANHPKRHLVLQEVIHGPFHYPTGGDKSHQLLDLICALKCQFPKRVHFLLGNHELAQLTGMLVQKNDTDLNEIYLQGVRTSYGSRGDEVYAAYMQLLQNAPLAIRTANRLFLCHSVPTAKAQETWSLDAIKADPTPEDEYAPGKAVYSLVWGRDVTEQNVRSFLAKVDADHLITGHIPCDEGFARPSANHVILDTQGHMAAYALVPADRPVSVDEWNDCIHLL